MNDRKTPEVEINLAQKLQRSFLSVLTCSNCGRTRQVKRKLKAV